MARRNWWKKTLDSVGITNFKEQNRKNDIAAQKAQNAKEYADASINLGKKQMAFQKEQYDAWKDIYGDLQEDLGEYYKNMTGETITHQQLTQIQKESQKANDEIEAMMARKGMSGSGLEAEILTGHMYDTARNKATIRANSDNVVAQQKAGFLALGLNQGTQLLNTQAGLTSNVMGAGNSAANVMGSISNTNTGAATQMGIANAGNVMDVAGGVAGYSSSWLPTPK